MPIFGFSQTKITQLFIDKDTYDSLLELQSDLEDLYADCFSYGLILKNPSRYYDSEDKILYFNRKLAQVNQQIFYIKSMINMYNTSSNREFTVLLTTAENKLPRKMRYFKKYGLTSQFNLTIGSLEKNPKYRTLQKPVARSPERVLYAYDPSRALVSMHLIQQATHSSSATTSTVAGAVPRTVKPL